MEPETKPEPNIIKKHQQRPKLVKSVEKTTKFDPKRANLIEIDQKQSESPTRSITYVYKK